MGRFIGGVVVGGIGGGITYAIADSTGTAILVGVILACLIWFGLEILEVFT